MASTFANVAEYIAQFPLPVQALLKKIRKTIKAAAPNAVESISYGMPAYKLNGKPLLYFAAYPHHIGLYATPSGHNAFEKELSVYKQGKGSVQFPITEEIPYSLIERITAYRVANILAKKI